MLIKIKNLTDYTIKKYLGNSISMISLFTTCLTITSVDKRQIYQIFSVCVGRFNKESKKPQHADIFFLLFVSFFRMSDMNQYNDQIDIIPEVVDR